jgi:hypothetical protein
MKVWTIECLQDTNPRGLCSWQHMSFLSKDYSESIFLFGTKSEAILQQKYTNKFGNSFYLNVKSFTN